MVLGGLGGLAVVAQAWLLSRAVALGFLGEAGLRRVGPWLLALAALALVRAGLAWSSDTMAARGASWVRVDLRTRATRRLLDAGPARLPIEPTGELANTLVGGIEATDGYLRSYLPQAALAAVVPAIVLVAVALADPLSALVLLLTYPLIPLFMYLVGGVARARTRRQWVVLSRMSARFVDAVEGLSTLKAFGRSREEADVIAATMGHYRVVTMGVLRIAFVSALVLEWLATLGTAIVAVEVGLRLLYARVAFEPALFVLVLAPEFYRPLRALGASFHAGMAGREAGTRIGAILAGPADPQDSAGPASRSLGGDQARAQVHPWVAGNLPPRIVLEGVRYRYPSGRGPALDGLDVALEPGTMVALVGPSGAGKSTVFHLLLRFADPQDGRILAGDRDLRGIDAEQWRGAIAWVPQHPHVFDGTLLDNLRLARPEATLAQVEAAVRLAHADAIVDRLPKGIDTLVGVRGERLSGGEAQRLALARAFLKDAPIVLLDEPTAHLDPASESAVGDGLARLREGRTVLLIAHRITTSARADRIVLMNHGRSVEQGSHDQLVAAGGVYRRLVSADGGAA